MLKNPFNPSFSYKPDSLIDRSYNLDDLLRGVTSRDKRYAISLVTGVRGSGKTVFLSTVKETISTYRNMLIVDLIASEQLLDDLLLTFESRLADKLPQVKPWVSSVEFTLGPVTVASGKRELSFGDKLVNLLTVANDNHLHVVFLMDELKVSSLTRDMISYFNYALREGCDFHFIAAGLPDDVLGLQESDHVTFLKRAYLVVLETLDPSLVKADYKKAFSSIDVSNETLDYMTNLTLGYPYAYQLIGYHAYDIALVSGRLTKTDVDSILDLVKLVLNQDVYDLIWQSLSQNDKTLVKTLAEHGGYAVEGLTLRKHLGWSHSYYSQYRKRIQQKGLAYTPSRGLLSFSLPFFKGFVLDVLNGRGSNQRAAYIHYD